MEGLLNTQFVVYELLNEKYALKISDIYEIIRLQKITEVHNSNKEFLIGVINLRGKIVPVINIHKRLGLKEGIETKSSRIVIVQGRNEMVGIVVDRVSKVIQFDEIQQPPEMLSEGSVNYFEGIGLCEDGIASLIKIDKVLYD